MITALIIAVVLVAAAFAALVVIAARLDPHGIAAVPLRRADELLAGWLSPPPGDHHKFAAPDAAPMTPASRAAASAGQAPDAAPQSAPPGGAAPLPHPASLGVGQPPSPAPLSKALEAAPGGTGPATLPRPGDPPAATGAVRAGQHPERQPWVIWHRPHGEQVVIGYGPAAEIPRPYAQARITGAHVIVPDPPLVSRRMAAHEQHVDGAVNS